MSSAESSSLSEVVVVDPLSADVQSLLATLIHHSTKSRNDLCKELIAAVESSGEGKGEANGGGGTPSPTRPHSSASASSDKENHRANGSNSTPPTGENVADRALMIDSFLDKSAVYDTKKSLWVLNDEVKMRYAVADKLHPFFLKVPTTPVTPTSSTASAKRRRSTHEQAGTSMKAAPTGQSYPVLVIYSPSPEPEPGPSSSVKRPRATVEPQTPGLDTTFDEEDLAILKKHRFKNVAVHVINSPEVNAMIRGELPADSPTTSRASSGRTPSLKGKGKRGPCRRRQSVVTGKIIRKKSAMGKEGKKPADDSKATTTRQKYLNAFFKPTTPANVPAAASSAHKHRRGTVCPSPSCSRPSTGTPHSLALSAEEQRKQQLRVHARKIRKAVEEFNAKEGMKAARLAVKDFSPTATLPTAEALGINTFIHHLMARELATKREKDATAAAATGNGETLKPKKRGPKPASTMDSGDGEYLAMEKLLGQLMIGKVEDLLAKASPLPTLEPVPLPPTSPSAANDYTNFTTALVFSEWLATFGDLLGLSGSQRLPSALQLIDATVDSTRETFHHCTGRALKAMCGYFLAKTDVGRAMVEKKMVGALRSAAEAELSGHRKGAAISIGNAFKTAMILLGVEKPDEQVAIANESPPEEPTTDDPAESLFKEELSSVTNFWELPADYQLELLRRMMELISDSNEFDTHLEESLNARSKAMEEKKEAEAKIAELRPQVDEAAAQLPSTSDDALEQMTREETRELVRKRKDLEGKQSEMQELEERCRELDALLTQLKAGVSKRRVSPLGVDRWHRKYWFFNSPNRGLYIEDGGLGGSPEAASEMTELRTGMDFVERLQWDLNGWPLLDTTPANKSSQWYRIRTTGQFNALCARLSTRGVREEALLRRIKSVEGQIVATLEPVDDIVPGPSTPVVENSADGTQIAESNSNGPDAVDAILDVDSADAEPTAEESSECTAPDAHDQDDAEVIEISDDDGGED